MTGNLRISIINHAAGFFNLCALDICARYFPAVGAVLCVLNI